MFCQGFCLFCDVAAKAKNYVALECPRTFKWKPRATKIAPGESNVSFKSSKMRSKNAEVGPPGVKVDAPMDHESATCCSKSDPHAPTSQNIF